MALYRDSVGNTYAKLPSKKENRGAKGASPGPKHGKRHGDIHKKHGDRTGLNGPRSRDRYFGDRA